jgi:hypothetical protein
MKDYYALRNLRINIFSRANLLVERGFCMTNKLKTTNKKAASLGIRKNEQGDYEYINPEDKNTSKYKPIRREPK